jgi:hypothetical protein
MRSARAREQDESEADWRSGIPADVSPSWQAPECGGALAASPHRLHLLVAVDAAGDRKDPTGD